jgi:hypothetical protein
MTTKSNTSAPEFSTQATAKQPAVAPQPTHRLYRVNGDGNAAIWTPIGAAWPNKDGKGFNLNCDAVPLAGRMVLRLITPREAA